MKEAVSHLNLTHTCTDLKHLYLAMLWNNEFFSGWSAKFWNVCRLVARHTVLLSGEDKVTQQHTGSTKTLHVHLLRPVKGHQVLLGYIYSASCKILG